MFDKHCDFALNRSDKDAIVCQSVTGEHIRLTQEDFASEEEFNHWKAWSDDDYHQIQLAGRNDDDCLSFEDVRDAFSPSAEDVLLAPVMAEEAKKRRKEFLRKLRHNLTETQYRRLCLYYLEGKTEEEIAVIEGVKQQRISKSLIAGKKFVEKIFKEFLENRG